ncbi:MAG: cytochrome-c peroxidase [Bacteroidia bacterium]
MRKKLLLLFGISSVLFAFNSANNFGFHQPAYFPKPIYDFSKNTLTENKIQLGRALFYDPILSRDSMISCASCHSQYLAFTHGDHALSHGIEDRIGTRNSPALMNLAWQTLFMRDGAVNHLDMLPLAPISNPLEMDERFDHVVAKLVSNPLYKNLFYKAYGDSSITGERTLKALSQFMLTLISANSKYDSVMKKQTQFTEKEGRGYALFKQVCATCHSEPLFTNDEFRNNGLPVDTQLRDYGRYGVTKNGSDSLKFKVPTLRNIEFSYPYMHDGRFKNLSSVLNHYTKGIIASENLGQELKNPIQLSSNEKVEIIAFLLTLTDKSFLFNPDYSYPKEIFSGKAKD